MYLADTLYSRASLSTKVENPQKEFEQMHGCGKMPMSEKLQENM